MKVGAIGWATAGSRTVLGSLLLTAVFAVTGIFIPGGTPVASASSCYDPYDSWIPVQFADGSWDKRILLPNGTTIGWTKNAKSLDCGSAWFEHFALSNTSYTIDMSIWHPNQPSVDIWSGPWWGSWQNTPTLDIRRGVQNCAGAQIYHRNGGWVRWQFFGCWTG